MTFCKLMFTFSRAPAQCWPEFSTPPGLPALSREYQNTWTDCVCYPRAREAFPSKLDAVGRPCVSKNQKAGFHSYTTILSNLSETTYRKYFKYWKKRLFSRPPNSAASLQCNFCMKDSRTRDYQGFSALLSMCVQKSSRLLKIWNPTLVAQENESTHFIKSQAGFSVLLIDWKEQTQPPSPPKATGRKMRWMLPSSSPHQKTERKQHTVQLVVCHVTNRILCTWKVLDNLPWETWPVFLEASITTIRQNTPS